MDRGLSRIILIDSYMPSRATEVAVTGHTSINGDNGAGKTSLLRLVPIFYGEHPRNLVTKTSSGRKSFATWYLPRQGSYLVFEYRGADDYLKMAIFRATSAEDDYQQVLVDGEYDELLFLDARAEEFLPTAELLRRLKDRGLAYHVCQTNDEYRAILMDGTRKNELRYSMVGRNARMAAVVPLVTHMFQRNVSFEHFARIIQNYARDGLSAQSQKILRDFKPRRHRLSQLVEQHEAFSALEGLRPRLPEVARALGELKLHQGKRDATALAALQLEQRLQEEIDNLAEEFSAKDQALKERHQQFEATLTEEKARRKSVVGHLNEQESIQNRLATQQLDYEKQELPHKARELGTLPDRLATLDARRQELLRLESDLAGAEGPIKEAIADEERRAHQARIRHEQALSEAQKTLTDTREQLSNRHQKANSALQQRQEQERDALQQKLNEARDAKVRLETQLENPRIDSAISARLEQAEAMFERAQEGAAQTDEIREDARARLNKAQRRYDLANLLYDKARDTADDAEASAAQARELLSGGPDSLIQFLGQHTPGWPETLGRVINPAILRETGLSPELVEAADTDVFGGVRLDVSSLPVQPLAPAELQAAYEEAVRQHEAAEATLQKAEAELEGTSKERQIAEKACTTAVNQANIADRKRSEAQQALSDARLAGREAKTRARTQIEIELAVALQRLSELRAELQLLRDNQIRAQSQLEDEYQERLAALAADHRARLAHLDVEQEAREEEYADTLSRLEAQRQAAIAESGVAPAEITSLRDEIKKLKTLCEQLESLKAQVSSYEQFLTNEWPGHDEAEAAAAELRSQRDRIDAEIAALQESWESEQREGKNALAALTNTLKTKRNAKEVLEPSAALRFAKADPGLSSPEADLSYYLTLDAEALTQEHITQQRQVGDDLAHLQNTVANFVATFQRYLGSPSHEYWLQAQDQWAQSDITPVTQAKAVEEYFNNGDHDLARSSLIQAFNYLDILDNYRLAMEEFERGVARFNRELGAHLEQDLRFDLIDRVEPKITLDLTELDFWQDLRQLVNQYGIWKKAGGRDVPDHSLVKAIEAYGQTIRDDKGSVDDFSSLIRFQFYLEIDGSKRRARSARDLEEISSNGLSYIVLILLFQGFVDLVRGKHPIAMLWPLDELGAIDASNRRALLQMLSEHKIALLTATPNLGAADLAHFSEAYELENRRGRRRLIQMQWAGHRVAPVPLPQGTDGQREHSDG